MRSLFVALLALASADAATRVAVVELGKSGTVRRTSAKSDETSTMGVASFWSSLHGYGRKLQHAGMTVVPDIFSRPESGVVIGFTGVDLDTMPTLNGIMTEEGQNNVVGHMEVQGEQCGAMLKTLKVVEKVEPSTLEGTIRSQSAESGISGMKMEVTNDVATSVDAKLATLLNLLNEEAEASGKTVVLHIIVEEDEGVARRRHLARRLNEEEGEDNKEGEEENKDEENNDKEEENNNGDNGNADGNNGNDQQFNGYYGYGYYNAYGEWVTPYKTMFQIQYFNVVVWTSVGLFGVLFYSMYMFIYMPLMADTLLFGEAAKMAHDD